MRPLRHTLGRHTLGLHTLGRHTLGVGATAAAVLLLAACATTSPSSSGSPTGPSPDANKATGTGTGAATELAGTQWNLTSYADDSGSQVPAATKSVASIKFGADGKITGSTGCNRFSGTYSQDGSKLTIALGPMTQRACTDDPVMKQENALVAALPKVASFTSTADALTLRDASGAELLVFAPGLSGLAGTSWQATGINNGKQAVVSNAQTENVTAVFGDDGRVTGSGGCNNYRATFTVADPDGLTFGPVAATKKACQDEVNTVEQQYFAALEKVATYTIDGDTLTLRDAGGSTQAVFRLAG